MKTDFKFSNLLGTVFSRGNLLYSPDGNSLYSPVGNRVTVFDLVNNKSHTLPFAHRKNISRLALNPQGNLLLTVDEDGKAILTNVLRRVILYHFSFRQALSAIQFSPSGRHFVAAVGRRVEIWQTPQTPGSNQEANIEFAPFVRYRDLAGHTDSINSIEWAEDSRFFLTTSRDLTTRIWSLDPEQGFKPTVLAGHKQAVVGAWFSADQEKIWTVSQDGALFQWQFTAHPTDETKGLQWRIVGRHFFMQNQTKLTCAAFHPKTNLLVAGFSNGVFTLYDLPDFSLIQKLSISQNAIDFVAINPSGEWLAFGASQLGQLLVWEWQSESYILKQQSHYDSINALTYTPDGQRVITAADDGKLKVWDVQSGFCIVTFTEHTSAVTACAFSKKGNVLFTASLDGSVRAWDLIRYRNFRTFTADRRVSFTSLAVDPSGDVICAGSTESFDIHVWSVQTGQLVDQLAAHEGPVVSLAFSSDGNALASGSWDKTVRIWSLFARTQTSEPLQLQSDVLAVTFRPDGQQLAVSTLDGQLSFWKAEEALQEAGIDGRRDASGGRKLTDRRAAANVAGTKSFNSLMYSADGTCIIAGGNSKYICMYEVQSGSLVRKFTVSTNLSIDGTQEFLNSKMITDSGDHIGLVDETGDASDLEDRLAVTLPGAVKGDAGLRRVRPEVRVSSISFSPTGRAFVAGTTEGLLIYSLDTTLQFDPFDLDITITPETTLTTLNSGEFVKALIMAFRLNDKDLLRHMFESIPYSSIPFVVRDFPVVYLARLLRLIATQTDEGPHLEFCLRWIETVLRQHGRVLKGGNVSTRGVAATIGASAGAGTGSGGYAPEMRLVSRAVARIGKILGGLAKENVYLVEYLLTQPLKEEERVGGVVGGRGDDDSLLDADDDEMEDDDGAVSGEEGSWMGVDDE